jgi:hypothetical protein
MDLSMGKREKPQTRILEEPAQPSFLAHLSIVIAYFFYRCTAVRISSNSSVPPEYAIRAPMKNGRSSGGSSDRTAPHHVQREATTSHEVEPPPPSPTFGGHLDAEVSTDGEQGPPARSAGAGPAGLRQRLPDTAATGFTTPVGLHAPVGRTTPEGQSPTRHGGLLASAARQDLGMTTLESEEKKKGGFSNYTSLPIKARAQKKQTNKKTHTQKTGARAW